MCFPLEILFALGMLVSSTDAAYVNVLRGVVELPMVTNNVCSRTCPVRNMSDHKRIMETAWEINERYIISENEYIRGYERRPAFVGAQTQCQKRRGAYRCKLPMEDYCDAVVLLGFNKVGNGEVKTRFTNGNIQSFNETKTYNGRVTEYVYSCVDHYRASDTRFSIRFLIKCSGNEACLLDNMTTLSLQYRYTEQSDNF